MPPRFPIPKISGIRETGLFSRYFCGMLTKIILTVEGTEHEVPDHCIANWEDISFVCKRTDYSGVMRSFSSEFVFAGEAADLLWGEYLTNGFHAVASVAVYTLTDRHGWEYRFGSALDFSTLEKEDGKVTINAVDNEIASLIKAKKSQKYEFPVSSFATQAIRMERLEIKSYATFLMSGASCPVGPLSMTYNSSSSQTLSTEYFEPNEQGQGSQASYFITCKKVGAGLKVDINVGVTCLFGSYAMYINTGRFCDYGQLSLITITPDVGGSGNIRRTIWTGMQNDLRHRRINGIVVNMYVGLDTQVFGSVSQLEAAAASGYHPDGSFGVVGSYSPSEALYWSNNTVYELVNGSWVAKGPPESYYQERHETATVYIPSSELLVDTVVGIFVVDNDYEMSVGDSTLTVSWGDPAHSEVNLRCIRPGALLAKLVGAIAPGTLSVIEPDTGGLLADTYIIPGEELRQIYSSKIYTSFKDFADWMEAVFGYTYKVDGSTLTFLHRSAVFPAEVGKEISDVSSFHVSVDDSLIYATVEAGYPKKEYGEIDGRLEKNFTNYYTTGYNNTDGKLSLVSKYRSDAYGLEFTMRKSESDTQDDKADEDVFFCRATGTSLVYAIGNNDAFAPAMCVENNQAFISVLGNGSPVHLTMTSSNGDNVLEDVDITGALFTCSVLEFTTDDLDLPSDMNAMVKVRKEGYMYQGFILEAKANVGRQAGTEYKLILKNIQET